MVTTSTTSATWDTWCTGSTVTASTSTSYVWGEWCDDTSTTGATTGFTTSTNLSGDTWIQWVNTTSGVIRVDQNGNVSDEFREMVEREAEQRQAERLEHAKLHNQRKAKATRLLRNSLTRKQKKDFDKRKYFYVRGNVSGNLYKIKHGRTHNVEMLDKFKNMKQRLCAHPGIYCPDEDTMLSQKIMLENMEDNFREIANITYH